MGVCKGSLQEEIMRRFTSVRDNRRIAAWGSIVVGGLVRVCFYIKYVFCIVLLFLCIPEGKVVDTLLHRTKHQKCGQFRIVRVSGVLCYN